MASATLVAGVGNYAWSIADTISASTSMPSTQGSYALSGRSAVLVFSQYTIHPAAGSYVINGANSVRDFTLPALPGSYGITGQTMSSSNSHSITASSGSYSIVGRTTNMRSSRAVIRNLRLHR